VHRGFWWGNLREREHLGDPGVDERGRLKMKKYFLPCIAILFCNVNKHNAHFSNQSI
jgi:hypothetical protein